MRSEIFFAGMAVVFAGAAYMLWPSDAKTPALSSNNETTDREMPASTHAADGLTPGQLQDKQRPLEKSRNASTLPEKTPQNVSSQRPPPDLAVPARPDDPADRPDHMRLWQSDDDVATVTVDGLPAMRLQVDPDKLGKLRVGQTLKLDIPNSGPRFEAEITDTHNDPNGVQVWQAKLADAIEEATVIISQGKVQTHLTIASERGNYSVIIDNKSGASTLIDEGEINARQAPVDDGIAVGPPDESTLPPIN